MSNINNNRVNSTLTEAQIVEVKVAVQSIYSNIPFLLGLTVEERISLPKKQGIYRGCHQCHCKQCRNVAQLPEC